MLGIGNGISKCAGGHKTIIEPQCTKENLKKCCNKFVKMAGGDIKPFKQAAKHSVESHYKDELNTGKQIRIPETLDNFPDCPLLPTDALRDMSHQHI